MTDRAWDPDLTTGDSVVDGQHQRLFALFNELHAAGATGEPEPAVDDILDRLSEYIMVHFEAERRLMVETALDPAEMAEHLRQHEDLTNQTRDMILRYRCGELTSTVPLALFLSEWLSGHIRQTDVRFVRHVRAVRGDGG